MQLLSLYVQVSTAVVTDSATLCQQGLQRMYHYTVVHSQQVVCNVISGYCHMVTLSKTCLLHRELGAQGVNSLLAVPVSFVSEHIETLEEIDMEYRELAHESGIQNWGRVPALNTNPVFIDDLAEAVLEALPYVGSMAGSNPSDAMVPLGELQTISVTASTLQSLQFCCPAAWSSMCLGCCA